MVTYKFNLKFNAKLMLVVDERMFDNKFQIILINKI